MFAKSLGLVRLSGEFDLAEREHLSAALASMTDVDVAVIDFTNVTYIDSSALTCLTVFHRSMEQAGKAPVHIVGANAHIKRILTITGLYNFFTHAATLADVDPALGAQDAVAHDGSGPTIALQRFGALV
jgi:anti-anti-sigma factor